MTNVKQYLKVLPIRSSYGVFTTIDIPAKTPICEVTGNLYNKDNVPDHPAIIQVGHNTYVGPSGDMDDYIEHSCDPNCLIHIVGNRAFLYAMYDIKAGSEITYDYSTSSTDSWDSWKMNCNCGSVKCRKIISGLQYLDSALLQEYKSKGMIPIFLYHPSFKR